MQVREGQLDIAHNFCLRLVLDDIELGRTGAAQAIKTGCNTAGIPPPSLVRFSCQVS